MESVKKFTNKGKDGIRRLMEHEESGWNIAVKCTVMVKKQPMGYWTEERYGER